MQKASTEEAGAVCAVSILGRFDGAKQVRVVNSGPGARN